MTISKKAWDRYVSLLRKLNETAAKKMLETIEKYGMENRDILIEIAYALATKYGEGAAALTCEMYDAIAEASGVVIPSAEPETMASNYAVG